MIINPIYTRESANAPSRRTPVIRLYYNQGGGTIGTPLPGPSMPDPS